MDHAAGIAPARGAVGVVSLPEDQLLALCIADLPEDQLLHFV